MPNIYTIEDLQHACRQQQKFKYLFFWGHTPKQKNVIDQAVFSQWFPSPFHIDGINYPTAEHYMMAAKARLFGATDIAQQIIASPSPKQAKALGRLIPHFNEALWQQHRFNTVYQGNLAKFSQHTALQEFLLHSHPHILVEASPIDSIWGIGMAQNHPHSNNPLLWQGLNLLGFILMKVRSDLIAQIHHP